MRSKIALLDESVINQIAAGEVIENAASVVKELVENSIDSGATEIKIISSAGGRQLISIRDNGCGMNEKEIELALMRHATSKISKADDLYDLSTLGFRGEALSTIASVAKMTVTSGSSENPGASLEVHGGKKIKMIPFPRQMGTTIDVSSLFYNVPARKKFQKSVASDTAEIHRTLIELALSHPELSFEWVHDEKVQFAVSQNMPLQMRIETLLGEGYCSDMVSLTCDHEGYHLSGFISLPILSKPTRKEQFLFVNKRAISSPFLSSCIQEAYGERLGPNRYPLFILYLTSPNDKIDVNIHPRKKEVRFQESDLIRNLVLSGVRETFDHHFAPTFAPKIALQPLPFAYTAPDVVVREMREEKQEEPSHHLLCVFQGYLFVKLDEEILVIDQKRARERIFFEKLKAQKPAIQRLLFPHTIEVSPMDYEKLLKQLPLLHELGIEARPFGKQSFVVETLPEVFHENEIDSIFHLIVEVSHKETLLRKLTAEFSMRKKEFSHEESVEIMRALFRCQEPHITPSGKPTTFKITEKEIAKWLT